MGEHYEQYLRNNRSRHLEELKQYLSIPSISALSGHKQNMVQAAEWTAEALRRIGIEHVQVMPTGGHPVVYGEWLKAEGKPTALIYGHYDVQPVDPLHLWDTPPFEPVILEDKIYARGASDNKGQIFMHIKALEALLAEDGTLPVNVKLCIEGEEEIGSVHLDEFVEVNKEHLAADVLVISDSVMYAKGKPAICYGLRGLCGMQINVKGPSGDLHSGLYGGAVQNPVHALVQILSSMRNEQGEITIGGFYDQVRYVPEEERERFRSLQFNEEQMSQELQVAELFGERGYSALERTWVRPTLEINGIYGGFQGEGVKTVLPSEAHAKLTCRLVPDQSPNEIIERIQRHIDRHTPPGVSVTTTLFDTGKPFVTPVDHPVIQAAGRAYREAYGVEAVYIRSGGSIPVVATFAAVLNVPVVMMGFGLSDENIHAPNEHFHLENFDKGLLTLCRYWYELAGIRSNDAIRNGDNNCSS
ncbi:acetylornithine deacetylase/succinyl-diaminopimelate desuccinylase-like protein [Paenibacillus forsythiae]|uniref:Acetylornithine deacetylase/succinyl-diaminopimelate desuccinylase-like protein n=1 Tax=Paenibacillus forsythiae TaxID=365616 RepID=A0ABU3H2A4_9BACL|nr:dipeptidase [Paenibacillus forsythiae]MDT3424959.1 acetylornithine deacetylase/succinyl-diaminopimelate desuccinylase-like protein [Paenibacillus forsythiae]